MVILTDEQQKAIRAKMPTSPLTKNLLDTIDDRDKTIATRDRQIKVLERALFNEVRDGIPSATDEDRSDFGKRYREDIEHITKDCKEQAERELGPSMANPDASKPGWLRRQYLADQADFDTWPEWMKADKQEAP